MCKKVTKVSLRELKKTTGGESSTGLAMTEEALRMVVLERLQTIWTPEIQRGTVRCQR